MTIYTGRFSGHEYRSARPLGDAPYTPHAGSWQAKTLPVIRKILVDEAAYLPLRPRAILYRLMGKRLATKADDGKVTDLIVAARRAHLLDIEIEYDDGTTEIMNGWDAIDDGRTVVHDIGGYDGPKGYWTAVRKEIDSIYRRHLRQGQEWWIEIYVESAGYLPVLQRVADEYGALIISGSGFNPVPRLRQTALEAGGRYIVDREPRQRTCVLFLGDKDKAGETRVDRSDADIRQFFMDGCDHDKLSEMGITAKATCEYIIKSRWLGLTLAQAVSEGLLDENGVKARPGVDGKFELEAVPPATVVKWVRDACEEFTDMNVLAATKATAAAERTKMGDTMDRLIKRWGKSA